MFQLFYNLYLRDDSETPHINTKSLATLSSIIFTLEKLFDETNNFAEGYQVGLCRTTVMKPVMIALPGGWMKKSNRSEKVWTYRLNLWCLNPAVVSSSINCIIIIILHGHSFIFTIICP